MATKTKPATPAKGDPEERYRAAQKRLRELQGQVVDLTDPSVPFAEGVVKAKAHRDDLTAAEDEFLAAHADLDEHRNKERAERQIDAIETLADATPKVRAAAIRAEELVDQLVAQFEILLTETERRYVAQRVSSHRNIRSHLGRNALSQWLTWRLRELKLPGLSTWVAKPYRKPLVELLLPDGDEDGAK